MDWAPLTRPGRTQYLDLRVDRPADLASGRANAEGSHSIRVAGRIRTKNVRNRVYVGAMTDDDTRWEPPPSVHRRMAWR